MKNIYVNRLESFSYAEVLDALNGVGAETQRLEFKREIEPRRLAQLPVLDGLVARWLTPQGE